MQLEAGLRHAAHAQPMHREQAARFAHLVTLGLALRLEARQQLVEARKRLAPWPQVDLLAGKAEAIPADDASYDAATCVYLFHELPPRVRREVARELARLIKPGGVLVLADSLQWNDNPALERMLEYFPHGFHEPYFASYLEEDLRALFAEAERYARKELEPAMHAVERDTGFRFEEDRKSVV